MDAQERLRLARLSLEGLSVGDGFGELFFFHPAIAEALIEGRKLVNPPWRFTDDTNMALSIYEILRKHGEISQDALAESFAEHYHPMRGYGPAMHDLLRRIRDGESWQELSRGLFDGQGSYGNGAAMRIAPLGAYFSDDIERVIEQAEKSSEITHANREGIAGGIAIAVAAAYAARLHGSPAPSRQEFMDLVLPHVPDSEVKSGIKKAREIRSTDVAHVIGMVGNGSRVTAQDTVPFTLWCAGECLNSFEDAMWLTASGFGDVDTTCAIVGGIVAPYVGQAGIPEEWIKRREELPAWALEE